jgi:hypothetical protein
LGMTELPEIPLPMSERLIAMPLENTVRVPPLETTVPIAMPPVLIVCRPRLVISRSSRPQSLSAASPACIAQLGGNHHERIDCFSPGDAENTRESGPWRPTVER